MNKIVIDNNKFNSDLNGNITLSLNNIYMRDNCSVDVEINGNCNFNIYIEEGHDIILNIISNSCKGYINYYIGKNSSLRINQLGLDNSLDIKINLDESSGVIYNNSCINTLTNKLELNVYHNAKNTNSKIINHGLNMGSNLLELVVNGYIYKDSINCNCSEDNRIINYKDGAAIIRPNLIIDNDMIEASHSAYIGSFDKEQLFYLLSRGIGAHDCYLLLIKAFLIGFMDKDEDEKYVKFLDKIQI